MKELSTFFIEDAIAEYRERQEEFITNPDDSYDVEYALNNSIEAEKELKALLDKIKELEKTIERGCY